MKACHARLMRVVVLGAGLLCGLAHAAVTTTVEPRLVEELDTVYLTLRVDGAASTQNLDLAPLQEDFEVLGNNTQSQFRSVNGRVEAWVEYQISLRPRRTGELLVPALKVGNEQSEPVQVMVRAMDPSVKKSIERMIFFETELTADPVYVQAETVLKRRLYYSNGVQIYSDLPGPPEIANAVVIPLGETQSRSALRDGQRYGVIEQQFAIFPEQSGTLIIPEISITSSVRLQSGGRIHRSGTRISTSAERLEVLPIPPEYPSDKPWLPATDVRIVETWSPDRASTKVGEPLLRSLAVTVIGNTGSVIPPLGVEFSDTHFKWYPEAPALADDNSGQQIVGSRIESYSLIPIKPGPAPLTEVDLTWWDTDAHKVRVARLPKNVLSITGSPIAHEQPPPEPETTAAPAAATSGQDVDGRAPVRFAWPAPWILLLAALTGAAVVAAVVLGKPLHHPREARAAVPPRAHQRAAWANLQRACRGNDVAAMRAALVKFIEARNGNTGDGLARFTAIDGNAIVWEQLNEAVFGHGEPTTISGAQVLQAAARLRKRTREPPADPLPALFSA